MADEAIVAIGIPELCERLARLSRRVAGPIARQALKKGAAPMEASAKAAVRSRTGLLVSRIRTVNGKRDRPGRFSQLVKVVPTTRRRFAKSRASRARHAAIAGRERDRYHVFYAVPLEFGHGTRKRSGLETSRVNARSQAAGVQRVRPYPFMGPAFDRNVDITAATAEEELMRGIEEETR